MFKATRPDGTDFRSGTIDYAAALESGATVRHPFSTAMIRDEPQTYLSTSTEKAETLIGGSWPCRLFEVEPVGAQLDDLIVSPYKRAVVALRVTRELPAHEALGPNGVHVVALIERAKTITADEAGRLHADWYADWYAAGCAAGCAAWYAARYAARYAAWCAAGGAAGGAAWYAAGGAAGGAARALVVRDLIGGHFTQEQYDLLTQPWASVLGKVHPDDAPVPVEVTA